VLTVGSRLYSIVSNADPALSAEKKFSNAPRRSIGKPARPFDARFAEAESIRLTGLSTGPRRAIPREARSQKKVSDGKILTRVMPHETCASQRKARSEIVERSWWDG
jgi:hypothetical protein